MSNKKQEAFTSEEIQKVFKFLKSRGMPRKEITKKFDLVAGPLWIPITELKPVFEKLLTGKWEEFESLLQEIKYYEGEFHKEEWE